MFIIYENIFRYMSGSTSSTVIGYVKTERDAKKVCEKLNAKAKEKNNTNSMGSWDYTFKYIKYIDINDMV